MKKTLVVLSSLIVIVGVFTSSSFANGGGHGHHGKRGHKSNAQIFRATLTPPGATAPTGPTGWTETFHRHHGAPGATDATGPVGKVIYAQNKKRYALGVRVYKLSANTKYDVTIVQNASPTAVTSHYGNDHGKWGATGSTGATSTTPPPIDPITTDANGFGSAKALGLRSANGLDKHASYFVTVTNAAGEVVLRGDLVSARHKGHKGNCNLKKETGTSSRSKHHQ